MRKDFLKMLADPANRNSYTELAQKTIVRDLLDRNEHGNMRATDLPFWEGEPGVNGMHVGLLPGCVYIFRHQGLPVTPDGMVHDICPVLLVTGTGRDQGPEGNTYAFGINLNLLTPYKRAAVLQECADIDPAFWEREMEQLAAAKLPVYSKRTLVALQPDEGWKFIKTICSKYKMSTGSMAFRKYFTKNISRVRLVDFWQWKYIPFLDFGKGLRGGTISKLQKEASTK